MGRVQDQVAVVTGAATGLGRAIALRLAEEGARMALCDIDGAGLDRTVADITATGGQAFGLVGDVTAAWASPSRSPTPCSSWPPTRPTTSPGLPSR